MCLCEGKAEEEEFFDAVEDLCDDSSDEEEADRLRVNPARQRAEADPVITALKTRITHLHKNKATVRNKLVIH